MTAQPDSFGYVPPADPIEFAPRDEKPKKPAVPQNEEAEQALLGALLLNNSALPRVMQTGVKPEHFFVPVHGRIFEVIQTIIDRGEHADAVRLKVHFQSDVDLVHLGGGEYLADLVNAVVTTLSAPDFASTIVDLWKHRQLITLADEVKCLAYEPDATAGTAPITAKIEATLELLQARDVRVRVAAPMAKSLNDALGDIDQAQRPEIERGGVPFGLARLDDKIGYLQPAEVTYVGARNAMGKTAFMMSCVVNQASLGHRPGIFSLEMKAKALARRALARLSDVPVQAMSGQLNDGDYRAVLKANERLQQLPIVIDDMRGLTINDMRRRARAMVREHGVDVIWLDFMQKIRGLDDRKPEHMQIAENSRIMTELADELGVPVAALAQLIRDVDGREDPRPRKSDLRGSGALEQDATNLVFIHRPEVYLKQAEPQRDKFKTDKLFDDEYLRWQGLLADARGFADLIIGKNRDGEESTVRVRFDGRRQLFEDA